MTRRIPLGERIRLARRARGWTEAELADAVGVSHATVGRWETGETRPRGRDRPELARVLATPYHVLFPPEATAETMTRTQRVLLLSARRQRGGDRRFYIATEPVDSSVARSLVWFYLVEAAGNDDVGRRLWRLTPAGEETADVIRGER